MSKSPINSTGVYDINSLAELLIHKNMRIRETRKYQEEKNLALDRTMSCNRSEAINWLKHFMAEAISKSKDNIEDWEYSFLASYDIFVRLTNSN